ncbi:MAG TPA: hypothetical protein VGX28_13675 [Frankiaceae bacterium]|jgi:transposase-like protein|nr:hypothetical protein [Frankiaceae bacterium]
MSTARFRTLGDGWYAWLDGTRDNVAVHVRFGRRADGRLHIDALKLEGTVSAEALRSIPVGRIEAAANAQLVTPGAKPRKPETALARIPEEFRANAVRGYPDAFYDSVATAYRTLAASTPKPVAEIAFANEVPVTTAQRWVKEARRRGLLSPGHPGKAG